MEYLTNIAHFLLCHTPRLSFLRVQLLDQCLLRKFLGNEICNLPLDTISFLLNAYMDMLTNSFKQFKEFYDPPLLYPFFLFF